jgi:methionyl-tRNA formyltransferase
MSMNSSEPRVVLIGDGPTAPSAFDALAGAFPLVGVVRNVEASVTDPVVEQARSRGIPVTSAPRPRDVEPFLDEVGADVVVMSSYGRIVPGDMLERRAYLNVHYAPLPAYRGRANVNWAIINGEPEAAISVHSVVPGLDAGPILARRTVGIGGADTVTDLYERLNDLQRELLPEAVSRRWGGWLGDPQDESLASYACGRGPDDGLIDWTQSTVSIDRLVRALTAPFPGAFTFLGLERLTIARASVVDDPPTYVGRIPGRVIDIRRRTGEVDVLTGDGVLRIARVSVDGRQLPAADVITSVRDTLGLSILTLLRAMGR